jgi:glucan phosphoethanolaminetransferase (alkaline phosphatase superfamily)
MEIKDIIEPSEQSVTYSFLSNIMFFVILVYSWLFHSSNVYNVLFLKLLIVFWVIRYLYSQFTIYIRDNGRVYYQINNKTGIVVIILSLLWKAGVFASINVPVFVTILFAGLEIMSAESFTSDILSTIIIAYNISNLNFQ